MTGIEAVGDQRVGHGELSVSWLYFLLMHSWLHCLKPLPLGVSMAPCSRFFCVFCSFHSFDPFFFFSERSSHVQDSLLLWEMVWCGKGRCCESSNISLSHPFSGSVPATLCGLPSSLSLLNIDLVLTS